MTDLARLQIRVQSLETITASKRLDALSRSGARAERATGGLTSAFRRIAAPLAVFASATASLKRTLSAGREFGNLNAQLITATGSASNAIAAFEALEDFATQSPFDLQQVTTAFTRLVNVGLNPSEAALEAYGNVASATGKQIIQFVEAVADAATGEFERLKEFWYSC